MHDLNPPGVSVLFSEPKIPQCVGYRLERRNPSRVSVLFSEPKIPQSQPRRDARSIVGGFSALQRAENSSICAGGVIPNVRTRFQCSSASRKFLNSWLLASTTMFVSGFSALQRAENSSMMFALKNRSSGWSFSALQRAENSSIA